MPTSKVKYTVLERGSVTMHWCFC